MPTLGQLLILPPIFTRRDSAGRVVLTRKFIAGVSEYARHWPEGVQVLMEEGDPGDDLDNISVHPADLPFGVALMPHEPEQLRPFLQKSGVALLAAYYRQIPLAALCATLGVPAVYTTENALRTRLQMLGTQQLNPLVRLRRMLWLFQEERRQCRVFRDVAGLQCNGTPTFEAYRSLNPRTLLYFDSRVTRAMFASEEAVQQRTAAMLENRGPLRLAFSGRLVAIKGADHLIAIAEHLRQLGVPFTLSICGGGNLETRMRSEVAARKLEQHVLFRGSLDFERELLPFMKKDVDLFVCCHRQGDPSCTYLETMSCGVPIAGYANEAFAGVVAHSGAGWTSPMNKPRALAERIAALAKRPEEIREHALRSLAFAKDHAFEATFAARIAHMRGLARRVGGGEADVRVGAGGETAVAPGERAPAGR
ncbi:MAG: glycosyltransferase [Phycisphaerae bacterium]